MRRHLFHAVVRDVGHANRVVPRGIKVNHIHAHTKSADDPATSQLFDDPARDRCPLHQQAIGIVVEARPDVLNHNTETVPRLYRVVRSGARYERSLELLRYAKELRPAGLTKSGVMVGLGEETHELLDVFRDLAAVGCDILTIGQYLRPSRDHLPMARLYTPREFAELKTKALKLGFRHVESGPLVRSSYHAHEQAAATGLTVVA